ncbi:UNKNOWN [Stylonychia lemnae]|uniref:Uncharacterized protein n=1 Tax=Stylonychia lemnae TaxID=5949 RepID=A0A078AN39_STYLE|nr:UNKNOWN [Stylonychia lemnae]|eukprot:CDW83579.1 UNKNOWN [Stylonychia lemnae]
MRPTDLKFRSPKQRTPEFYNARVTPDGRKLNFVANSLNVKKTFPSQSRFPQYHVWEKVTGKFLGPGSYNDNDNFQVLKAIPCAAIYRNQSLGREAGRPAFIMIGNNLQYEPKFENIHVQRSKERVSVDEVGRVPAISAFGRSSIRQLRKSSTKIAYNPDDISTINHQSFINQSYNANNDSLIAYPHMNRPQSSYQQIRPMSQLAQSEQRVQSANQYVNDDKDKNDSPDNNQKSTFMGMQSRSFLNNSSNKKQDLSQSLGESQMYQNLDNSQIQQMYSNRLLQNAAGDFVNGSRVYYAKTANNFYNLSKGLWRPTKKQRRSGSGLGYNNSGQQLQKSINILQAYGEYDQYKKHTKKGRKFKSGKSQTTSSLGFQQLQQPYQHQIQQQQMQMEHSQQENLQ